MKFDLQPRLENDFVILTPLKPEDYEALYKVASDRLIWEQHPVKNRCKPDGYNIFFKESITSKGAFLVTDKKTGEAIGSTRFNPLDGDPHKIEIGWSFLARPYWGGHYNRAVKTLMLDYSFNYVEDVIFYIGQENVRSQKAVEKIGAEKISFPEKFNVKVKSKRDLIFRINRQTWKKLKKQARRNGTKGIG